MIRAFEIQHEMDKSSQTKVLDVLREYRITCERVADLMWMDFQKTQTPFNKMCDVKGIKSLLSERYKRNCAYQVYGTLKGFLKIVQDKFKDIVYKHNSFDKKTKTNLWKINRAELWMAKEHKDFSQHELYLAKLIFRRILKWYNKPSFKKQNMVLNANVAPITNTEKELSINLSTLEAFKPIKIPLKTNEYFTKRGGKILNSVQINLNRDKKLKVHLVKDVEPRAMELKEDKISLDIGLVNLFALHNGELYGRNFQDKLKHYDKILTNLAANRQRQGFKTRSRRYDLLTFRLKLYIKNEIHRVLNRIVKNHAPKEIVIENLDFRNQNLSKQFNRLISKFGKRIIEEKLESLSEEYGIKITKTNPAYTSQRCNSCGYVAKNNRTTQAKFECKSCHKKKHADVVGARNNYYFSENPTLYPVHLHKETILRRLVMEYLERLPRPCSWADGLLSENPYFIKYGNLRTA